MTRPIDETWRAEGRQLMLAGADEAPLVTTFSRMDDSFATDAARARLAAQAPAMARLLLRAVKDESDSILVPGGNAVCEWATEAEALLRAAGVAE